VNIWSDSTFFTGLGSSVARRPAYQATSKQVALRGLASSSNPPADGISSQRRRPAAW
jgi:hypothetical protein